MSTIQHLSVLLVLLIHICWAVPHKDFVGFVPPSQHHSPTKLKPIAAQAEIRGVGKWTNVVKGRLYFQELSVGGPVVVRGTIDGLTPGFHGLHIHENGNLTDECKAAGPHFNPLNKDHGDPELEHDRHVGDLGNIEALDMTYPVTSPRALVYLIDGVISLSPNSERGILNRAVVVHEDLDDLGRTDHEDSKKTGNAGKRVACGLITLKP